MKHSAPRCTHASRPGLFQGGRARRSGLAALAVARDRDGPSERSQSSRNTYGPTLSVERAASRISVAILSTNGSIWSRRSCHRSSAPR